jgi:hypothetical protein
MINIQKVAPASTTGRYGIKNIEMPIVNRSTGEALSRLLFELRREAGLQEEAARLRASLQELLVTALTG